MNKILTNTVGKNPFIALVVLGALTLAVLLAFGSCGGTYGIASTIVGLTQFTLSVKFIKIYKDKYSKQESKKTFTVDNGKKKYKEKK